MLVKQLTVLYNTRSVLKGDKMPDKNIRFVFDEASSIPLEFWKKAEELIIDYEKNSQYWKIVRSPTSITALSPGKTK